MPGISDLMREYERARYPADRRLDVHGEGPDVARERVLHWIRSRAHETPGDELLIIVERGGRPGRAPSPVARMVQGLLSDLEGKLLEWWQPFAPGSLAVRIARDPRMLRRFSRSEAPEGEGRTEATAGAARPAPEADIPPELLAPAARAAELRIEREELSIRLLDVVLREIWIEAQAAAMEHRMTIEDAIDGILSSELKRAVGE